VVTLGEILRWLVYRLKRSYYRLARRLLRGDRLLWRSERRFRALLESAPEAMVILDVHSHIVLVNAQAEQLYGYGRKEIVGKHVGDLIPKRLRAEHRAQMRDYMRAPDRRPTGIGLELRGLRKDGSEFPAEISLSPLETEEGLLVSTAIRDITDRQRAVAELMSAEELFRGVFDGSPIGMALTDEDGHIVRVNDALCVLTGRSPGQLTGTRMGALSPPEDSGYDARAVASLLAGDRTEYKMETRFIHSSAEYIWVAVQTTIVRDSVGQPMRFLVQVQDITHRRRYEENLHYLATHDPLTGLHNRSSFAGQLDAQADIVRRYGTDGALLLLDLDHFKYVNDTLGHHAGDQLIARVAKVLEGRLRESDVLARLGGDEFAALLPRADRETAELVANDLLEALRAERLSVPGAGDRTITASIGVAMFEAGDGATGEDVLVSADLAMYDAKEAGRNQIAVHRGGEDAQARMHGRITWAERIRVAIDSGRFTLVAQPIIELSTGEATQFEVLLRMRDDHGDLIPPSAFLSTAERLGMIGQIDAISVSKALRALAERGDEIGTPRVEINLSGASIGDPAILDLIERELRETELDPSRVIFEITETAAIANMAKAREFSEHLARLGCHFALDDFGAGFGSFYYLKHVAFDLLKIDGEFVRECIKTSTDRLVIQSVVAIARGLQKQTIAEHVGDADTVALLQKLGVDYGQGYFLGKPEPLEAFLDGLAAARAKDVARAAAAAGARRGRED
jgi:diguanylate cyclase (GGDEF)-like protein/PAS domain S-box-containing protein